MDNQEVEETGVPEGGRSQRHLWQRLPRPDGEYDAMFREGWREERRRGGEEDNKKRERGEREKQRREKKRQQRGMDGWGRGEMDRNLRNNVW